MTAESNPALILRVGIVVGQSLKRSESFVPSLSLLETKRVPFGGPFCFFIHPLKRPSIFLHLAANPTKTDPKNFRFISASALRGFSRFKTEPIDSAAWAADEVYGSLKAYYDKEY